MLQQIQRAHWAFDHGLQAGLNAGRVEQVEAKQRSHLLSAGDIVVADRALAGLAAVLRFEQVGQQPLYASAVLPFSLGSHLAISLEH